MSQTIINKKPKGRNKIVMRLDKMEQLVTKDRSITLKGLKRRLRTQASIKTISRRLRTLGFKKSYLAFKPKLNTEQINNRLLFANRMKEKNIDYYKKITFIDEVSIERYSNRRVSGWKKRKEFVFIPKPRIYVKKYVKFFATLKYNSVGPIIEVKKPYNSSKYIELLRNLNIRYLWDDNDPIHRSEKVMRYIRQKKIILIKPPSNSPDISPIENAFSILKRKLDDYRIARNDEELISIVKRAWSTISNETAESLVGSMPKRINMLMENQGNIIKY